MSNKRKGYVKKYNPKKGFGFCMVYNLKKDKKYTDVFFHISDIAGFKGVEKRKHVLRGKINQTSKGWKMTNIEASYNPAAWNRRPKEHKKSPSDNKFEKPNTTHRFLKNKNSKCSDKKNHPHREQNNSEDEKKEDSEGGYWKGDKYIP